MKSAGPWHRPGEWLVNPAYWDKEVLEERAGMPERINFIDCTLSEGDDCVGHQLNWNKRLAYLERLDDIGLGEITMPSHATFSEEHDLVKACRQLGLKTRLVAKGPGFTPPLKKDWREVVDRHVALGCEVVSPLYKWSFEQTISDFKAEESIDEIADAIAETVAYTKSQGVRVVPWINDSMRTPVKSACHLFKTMADAGADGVYVVDSRGNSAPLATRYFMRKVREAIGPKVDLYIQHHNDLGVATANAMAAVEGGANWVDCSVLGIADRGGAVALEEAATLFEMYGIKTGIKLEKLYEICRFVQEIYGIDLPPWKPVAGENWNKEEGVGHLDGSDAAEASFGVNPAVVGREFEGVIGGKILFGRERSSAQTDDPVFLRNLIEDWGMELSEPQFQKALMRARAAVATAYRRHYITLDDFRSICTGIVAQ